MRSFFEVRAFHGVLFPEFIGLRTFSGFIFLALHMLNDRLRKR